MGGTQSSADKPQARKSKNQPMKNHDHSNQPIRSQNNNGKPIKTQNGANGKKNNKNGPIIKKDLENQPIRAKKKRKSAQPETVDKATNTDKKVKKSAKTSKQKPEKKQKVKVANKKEEKANDNGKESEPSKDLPKKMSPKKQREQIEKEKKMQRVTKEQLRSLSVKLQRTAWYLGRRLGMTEAYVQRFNENFATEDERKYQILLWWRHARGWKATIQQLIILLELGGYTTNEYNSLLMSSNGDVSIYDKAPEILVESKKENNKKELYHYDVTQPKGSVFENMNYNSTIEVQNYERKHRNPSKENKNRERDTKHKSRQKDKDREYQTLPSWWKKPGDSTMRSRPKSSAVIYDEVPIDGNEKDNQSSQPKSDTQDGRSGGSHTDDSGIVTSPPISPKETENELLQNNRNNSHNFEVTIEVSDITTGRGDIIIGRNSKRASKTLIVRRCSDSAVKLRYQKYTEKKATKPIVSPITEYKSTDELEHIFPEHSNVINNNEVKRQSNSDSTKDNDDLTKNPDDVTNSSEDIINSNNDLTKHGYQNNIRGMIQKYETLTRLKKAASRQSITSNKSLTGNNFPAKTLPRNFTTSPDKTVQYTSKESLNKNGSRNSVKSRHSSHGTKTVTKYGSHDAINKTGSKSSSTHGSNQAINKTGQKTSTNHGSNQSINKTDQQRATRHSTISERLTDSRTQQATATYVPRYEHFSFAGKGKFPSRFKGLISGLAVFKNGDIIASDGDNKRIQVFNKRGKFLTTFDTNTELKPKGICITPDNNIAVCCGDAVNVYDREGKLQLSFGRGIFRNNSYCVCCDTSSNYYVTDIVSHTISIHDIKGRIRKRFGFQGSSMAHFNQPVSLAISKSNKLYITDSQNHCIKVYTLAGRPVFRIGAKGSADGLFWNPLGICLDDNDHLYVADCGNNRISEFDENCNFMRHVLTESDGLYMPSLVQMNKRGQLIICEWERQSIKVFSIETEV